MASSVEKMLHPMPSRAEFHPSHPLRIADVKAALADADAALADADAALADADAALADAKAALADADAHAALAEVKAFCAVVKAFAPAPYAYADADDFCAAVKAFAPAPYADAASLYDRCGAFARMQRTHQKCCLCSDPLGCPNMKERLVGDSGMITLSVKRLCQMRAFGPPLFSAINVNDSVTKSKFDNLYGCHSFLDALMRAADVMIAGKVVVVCGYGDVGKGCAAALKQAGARVIVTETDNIRALQALMEGLQVLTLEDVVSVADIFVNTTGNKDIIMVDDMRKMKNNAIVCNIGHFDNEIAMLGLETCPGVKRITIKPQTDRWVFPETNTGIIVLAERHLMNLDCGHPSFVMSCSFTNQVIAQLELWKEKGTGKYEKVYVLPKHLDEKVAALHLGAETEKSDKENEGQAVNKKGLGMVVQAFQLLVAAAPRPIMAAIMAAKFSINLGVFKIEIPVRAIFGGDDNC